VTQILPASGIKKVRNRFDYGIVYPNSFSMKKAIIFDMDGVVLDSEYHWREAGNTMIKRLIPRWEDSRRKDYIGLTIQGIYEKLKGEFDPPISFDEFYEHYDRTALDIYENKAQLMDGIRELLEKLEEKGIPRALASSSQKSWILAAIVRLGIEPFFKIIVSAEDVNGDGKPAPTIFLKAADQLGIEPEDCLVIEDATSGVEAAKRAHMFCIGFENGISENQDLTRADMKITGIRENTEKILSLLKS
jgi:HAD superfamily hydrolase (TIGR01509 family)